MRNPDQAEGGREPAELAGRRWAFGPAVLDERSLELEVGGQPTKLERKPLEVLLYLLHHAGEVVTKDDLAEALWPGRILTETVLTRCISLLRQALQDEARKLIRTVHGFGYRLVADVRVEVPASDAGPPALDYRPGDHPPLRPQWKLVERLGTGGHGEAWLARHEKTGDARVFKFALDSRALSSLKREITLYRLLHDSLGARAAVACIYEWNLAEPPYFIEMEYVTGGNLQAWSEAQGGLHAVPLTARLELAARIAEAIATAHSVGALHKDLKPGNVLIHTDDGVPHVRLCDFGSGGVLDPERLDALGITRQGFTKTLSNATTSATPLYIAPEVVAGQPFTVQADIYSLGVLLFQLVAGDLRKALAPGWESDVADELLREDIALAAAGNPAKRLTDAAQLAERLRTLQQRRDACAAEVLTRQRAERARRVQEELRRTRFFAVLLLALAAVAITVGVVAYRARNDALVATATAEAVSGFLTEDVLRVDAGLFRPTETSYPALLDRASREVGTRLKQQPKAAASIHLLLGRRYQEIGQFEAASAQYEEAVALFTSLYGPAANPSLLALDRLAGVRFETGRIAAALAITQEARRLWDSRLAANDLARLVVQTRVARGLLVAGEFSLAENELRAVVRESPLADPSTEQTAILFKQWLGIAPSADSAPQLLAAYANLMLAGNILEEVPEGHKEAEAKLRGSLDIFSRELGPESELSALTHVSLAIALASAGHHTEAEQVAVRARNSIDSWTPAGHYGRSLPRMALGRLRLEEGRFSEAVDLHQQAVDFCAPQTACPPRMRAELLWDLARAYDELGNEVAAVETFFSSIAAQEGLRGPDHPWTLKARIGLAEALRRAGRRAEALKVIDGLSQEGLAKVPPEGQLKTELLRTEGMLCLETGQAAKAVAALQRVLSIVERRFGASHWRTERARRELAAASNAAGFDK